MQRRIEAEDRAALWLERIVWNAAAAAALAVMVLVLLGSLQWLDEVACAAATRNSAPPPVSPRDPRRCGRAPSGTSAADDEDTGPN